MSLDAFFLSLCQPTPRRPCLGAKVNHTRFTASSTVFLLAVYDMYSSL